MKDSINASAAGRAWAHALKRERAILLSVLRLLRHSSSSIKIWPPEIFDPVLSATRGAVEVMGLAKTALRKADYLETRYMTIYAKAGDVDLSIEDVRRMEMAVRVMRAVLKKILDCAERGAYTMPSRNSGQLLTAVFATGIHRWASDALRMAAEVETRGAEALRTFEENAREYERPGQPSFWTRLVSAFTTRRLRHAS